MVIIFQAFRITGIIITAVLGFIWNLVLISAELVVKTGVDAKDNAPQAKNAASNGIRFGQAQAEAKVIDISDRLRAKVRLSA